MRLVLVDIGNSAIKLACLKEADGQTGGGSHRRINSWSEFDFTSLSDESYRWIVSSVNKWATDDLVGWLGQKRPQDEIVFASCENAGLKVSTDEPAQVGVDRLVAARAAWQQIGKAKAAAIVVDAGTAVTIDVVTRDGEFRGGLIYPGPDASFRQLNEQTAALPNLDFASRQKTIAGWQSDSKRKGSTIPWQTNTVNAITAGVFRTQLAGLECSVSDFAASIDGPAEVFLTGGAVPELLAAGEALGIFPAWVESAVLDQGLVLAGLKFIGASDQSQSGPVDFSGSDN